MITPVDILLVDDKPENLTVLESILEGPEYRLAKARSAQEALMALIAVDFALIVLDIRMPDTSGIELAQIIKGRKRTRDIPIIFLTITVGVARMTDIKRLGAVGIKTILYFEVISTMALAIGLIVGNLVQPGAGFNVDVSKIDTTSIATFQKSSTTLADTIFTLVPENILWAMSKGEILPVLIFAVLFGIGLSLSGKFAQSAVDAMDSALHGFFGVMRIVMRLAPIGAFGALAFTIGKFGPKSLLSLGKLMACVYITCLLFIVLLLGFLMRLSGLGLWPFLKYIREEIFIVLGTSSSESVLPR